MPSLKIIDLIDDTNADWVTSIPLPRLCATPGILRRWQTQRKIINHTMNEKECRCLNFGKLQICCRWYFLACHCRYFSRVCFRLSIFRGFCVAIFRPCRLSKFTPCMQGPIFRCLSCLTIAGFHLTSLRPCWSTLKLTKEFWLFLLFGTPTWPLWLLSFVSLGIVWNPRMNAYFKPRRVWLWF